MIKSFIAFKVPNLIESSHPLDSPRLEFNLFKEKKDLMPLHYSTVFVTCIILK